jgi:hypothetical protein
MSELAGSVGEGGSNKTGDVMVVQELLVKRHFRIGRPDGICGQRTRAAILTFQAGFMKFPDGRVDPRGTTWRHLTAPAAAPATEGGSLTRLVEKPAHGTINNNLKAVNNQYMTQVLGTPRENYSQDCQPLTDPRLRRNTITASVGPLHVSGLRPAILSLGMVIEKIRVAQPDVYRALGTAGMLCCRFQRGSTSAVSNHSWGTAIDLKLSGVLDKRGDNRVQFGLTLIAPIFNSFGWYWGAGFPTEDAMHFEASRTLIEAWRGEVI